MSELTQRETVKLGNEISRELAQLFEDKWVNVCGIPGDYIGETRAFAGSRSGFNTIYHTDKDCPHFPIKNIRVYPITYLRGKGWYRPCSHCTTEKS